ncbi:hypothetical protein V5O48_015955 [Marasmius crinis-equi]|uniref:Nephrocystin 3-like N-terminal domain-containing protein n=1 Tax=Marasmius crinis-equi TaxID=585013 RepID=A0ABR3ET35_9AGAR
MANYNFGRDQFLTTGGTVYVHNNSHIEVSVLQKLSPHVAFSALHNDKGRGSRTGCLEGTREDFLGRLSDWIEGPEGRSRAFWAHGGAGVGKSAVAQTLCERYFGTHLAASFYFSRNDELRNNLDRFVPTLVYQLVESEGPQSPYTSIISDVLRDYPRIMHIDWEEQFERLIRQPYDRVELRRPCRLVIIDGLDECMDRDSRTKEVDPKSERKEGQTKILSMIRVLISCQSPVPLRFLIFSRPEHTISNFLRTHTFTPEIEQFNMLRLRAETDRDIELYLRHELDGFKGAQPLAGLEAGEEVIQTLTHKADGLFIYVVTLMKHITSSSLLARDRLISLLRSGASAREELKDLDHLYHHILQSIIDSMSHADSDNFRQEMLLPILQLLVTPHYRPLDYGDLDMLDFQAKWRSKHAIARMLKLDILHVAYLLSRLCSVLYVPANNEHDEDVLFLHTSFTDFLRDERRSQAFHVQPMGRYTYFKVLLPYLGEWMDSISGLDEAFREAAKDPLPRGAGMYGGAIQIYNHPPNSELLRLSTYVAFRAMHVTRDPDSTCLDGTRTDLIRNICDWIETPTSKTRLCWVRGGAGVGKSAVAQTLCERYLHTHLAANFFLSRNDPKRDNLGAVVLTIAYQLATEPAFQQAGLSSYIDEVIPDDNDAFWWWSSSGQFERAFKELISNPCSRVDSRRWQDLPTVIIIDGLDECREMEQERLLSFIRESTSTEKPIPLRFLIFSRPEPTILNFFRTTPAFSTLAYELDMRNFRTEADRDIKAYIEKRFALLRSSYPEAVVGDDWPGEEAKQKLAHKADGHFVYVVAAMNYIASKNSLPLLPQQRLHVVLRAGETSKYPDLSDLDQLFHQILQSLNGVHQSALLPIIQLLITPHYHPYEGNLTMPALQIKWRTRYAIARLLQMDPRQVDGVLSQLRSVMYVPDGNEHDGEVSFLHAPFSDFLRDKRRSQRFYVEAIDRCRALRRYRSTRSFISSSQESDHEPPGYFEILLPYLDDWKDAISSLKNLAEQEKEEEESRIETTQLSQMAWFLMGTFLVCLFAS